MSHKCTLIKCSLLSFQVTPSMSHLRLLLLLSLLRPRSVLTPFLPPQAGLPFKAVVAVVPISLMQLHLENTQRWHLLPLLPKALLLEDRLQQQRVMQRQGSLVAFRDTLVPQPFQEPPLFLEALRHKTQTTNLTALVPTSLLPLVLNSNLARCKSQALKGNLSLTSVMAGNRSVRTLKNHPLLID